MRKKVPFRKSSAYALRCAALFLVFLLTPLFLRSQTLLVDINTDEESNYNEYSQLTNAGSRMYYISQRYLVTSQGTTQSTSVLREFFRFGEMQPVGTKLFMGMDTGSGLELFVSNGTVAGTVRVKELVGGTGGGDPRHFTDVNGTAYFVATNGKNGRELWKSRGDYASTVMVKDIMQVTGSSNPENLTNVNGTLFFSANDGVSGYELWKSDGTAAGTVVVKDIRPGKSSSLPRSFVNVNGTLYFVANNGTNGFELWKSDGTAAGTVMVKDIRSGATDGDVEHLVKLNNQLVFTANDGVYGDELWRSDGTSAGTVLVKDMNPGSAGSNAPSSTWRYPMDNFRVIGNAVYFTASKGSNEYIYRSDGTSAGTKIVADAYAHGLGPLDPEFAGAGAFVYFFNGEGLYRMDMMGNNVTLVGGITLPEDFYQFYELQMTSFQGKAYFMAAMPGSGYKFRSVDPTTNTVAVVKDHYTPTLGSEVEELVKHGDKMYIKAWSKLYVSDGTPNGTVLATAPEGYVQDIRAAGPYMYYVGNNNYAGPSALWRTAGTPESTQLVKQFDVDESYPQMMTEVGGMLFYTNERGEIWRSNGTPSGTIMLQDLHKIESITNVNGRAYVLAGTSAGGLELWKSTSTSLVRVTVVRRSGPVTPSWFQPTIGHNNVFYFVANNGVHGNEIWRSDGSTSGTFMMFNASSDWTLHGYEYDIAALGVYNNKVYFSAQDSYGTWNLNVITGLQSFEVVSPLDGPVERMINHNNKLIVTVDAGPYVHDYDYGLVATEGTPETTVRLGSVEGWGAIDHTIINGVVAISSEENYGSFTVTDGTVCGTTTTGVGAEVTKKVEAFGNHLVTASYFFYTGVEPYITYNFSAPVCQQDPIAAQRTATEEELVMKPYPNPFTDEFTLRVNNQDFDVADVHIYSNTGEPIETFSGLDVNVDHAHIGATWPRGIYYVKVRVGETVTSHTVIKK